MKRAKKNLIKAFSAILGPPINVWRFSSEPTVIWGEMSWTDFSPSPSLPIYLFSIECMFVPYSPLISNVHWFSTVPRFIDWSRGTHVTDYLCNILSDFCACLKFSGWLEDILKQVSVFYFYLHPCLQSALLGAGHVWRRKAAKLMLILADVMSMQSSNDTAHCPLQSIRWSILA